MLYITGTDESDVKQNVRNSRGCPFKVKRRLYKYLPWLKEKVPAKCLKTSSSGVREGVERTELKMELGVLSKG